MKNLLCPQCFKPLSHENTHQHVELEVCSSCHYIWLNHLELLKYFTKNKENIWKLESQGLEHLEASNLKCPSCSILMFQGALPGFNQLATTCSKCSGLWLKVNDLNTINGSPVLHQVFVSLSNEPKPKTNNELADLQKKISYQETHHHYFTPDNASLVVYF